jgi:hypothetical protein
MGRARSFSAIAVFCARHVACFCAEIVPVAEQHPMTQRAHFWLRIAGLALILAAEFGPRLWATGGAPAPSRVAAAVEGAGRR